MKKYIIIFTLLAIAGALFWFFYEKERPEALIEITSPEIVAPETIEEWSSVKTPFLGNAYHTTISNPTTGAQLSTYLVIPDGQGPFQTVLLVPGALNAGTSYVEEPMVNQLIQANIAVAYFDADGRGESTGEENANGYDQQDGLYAVSQALEQSEWVDPNQMGLASFSFGVAMSSGMLARYSESQPFEWYLDWEGPVTRNYVTQGCSEIPSEKVSNKDTAGNELLLTSCSDDAFWMEREALNYLPLLTIPYLRIQGEHDHVQESNEHAIDAINAATEGLSPWTRINDEAPNTSFTYDAPPSYFIGKKGSSIVEVPSAIEGMFNGPRP